jgi:hypothetical protein
LAQKNHSEQFFASPGLFFGRMWIQERHCVWRGLPGIPRNLGVFDDSDAYSEAIAEYIKLNPHVGDIQYRKLSPETYKEDLVEAFAAGKGPDIFMIRNAWRAPFENKTAPAPEGLLTEREYRESLVDVAQILLKK